MKVIIVKTIILIQILFSVIQVHSNREDISCIYLRKEIINCWKLYDKLPDCGNEVDQLLICVESKQYLAERQNCSSKTQAEISTFLKMCQTMKQSLCSDKILFTDFKVKQSCWNVVRNCSLDVAVITALDGIDNNNCFSRFINMHDCNQNSESCTYLLQRFAANLASNIQCSKFKDRTLLNVSNKCVFSTYLVVQLLILNAFISK